MASASVQDRGRFSSQCPAAVVKLRRKRWLCRGICLAFCKAERKFERGLVKICKNRLVFCFHGCLKSVAFGMDLLDSERPPTSPSCRGFWQRPAPHLDAPEHKKRGFVQSMVSGTSAVGSLAILDEQSESPKLQERASHPFVFFGSSV